MVLVNNVNLLGNLTKDPDVRYTKTGRAVATFTLACTNTYIDSATDVNCVAWGKLGESVGNLRKGSPCFVNGRLQTRSYKTKEGDNKYITEVITNFVGETLNTKDHSF